MAEKRDHLLEISFMMTIAIAVVGNGGVSFFTSAAIFTVFSILLLSSTNIEFHRSVLRRLKITSLLIAVVICFHTAVLIRWDEGGVTAHPVWRHLTEQFGSIGGTRAITRLQAVWELPGALVPLVAFAVAVPTFRKARSVERCWTFLAFLGASFAIYGLLQATLFPTWHFGERSTYVDSLSGFYVNRNVAAAFLVLTSLATLVVVDRDIADIDIPHWHRLLRGRTVWRSTDRRLSIYSSLFVVQFVALFLTKSRAGSVIGLIAIASFLAVRWRVHFVSSRQIAAKRALMIGAALAIGLVVLLVGRVSQRYDVQGLDDSRWCIYPAIARMALDNLPWGVGLGGFTQAFASYRDPTCGIAGIWDSAHDLYLQGITTMGIIFPMILILIAAMTAPPLMAALDRDGPAKPHATATLIATLAMAVHSIVDFPLEIPANAIVLATMIATTIGLATDRRRHIHRRPHPKASGMAGNPVQQDA